MDKRVITGKDTRRKHGQAFKRALVERSLQAGASVAAIAQESGINANLLFNWRRLHLRGQHSANVVATPAARLLPVSVVADTAVTRPPPSMPMRAPTGVIEIDIGGARVRLRGVIDEASLRCVLQALSALA
jgi:transposase